MVIFYPMVLDGMGWDPAYEDYRWDGDPYYPVYDENGYLEE